MSREFTNFVDGTLSASHAAAVTTMTVNLSTNSTVPTGLSASNYMILTIDPEGSTAAPEVVKATAITGSSNPYAFTIVRAQESTVSPATWASGTKVVASLTAAALDEIVQSSSGNNLYIDAPSGSGQTDGYVPDARSMNFGDSEDFKIQHSGTNTYLSQAVPSTGHLYFRHINAGHVYIQSGTGGRVYLQTGATNNTSSQVTALYCDSNNVIVNGNLTKSTGTFDIEHPTIDGWRLRHSFVESPQAELIYRGTITLDDAGKASVNMDTAAGLTEGTWAALCRNEWAQVAGQGAAVTWSVAESTLQVDGPAGTVCSWIVMAERADDAMLAAAITGPDGRVVTEYEDPGED